MKDKEQLEFMTEKLRKILIAGGTIGMYKREYNDLLSKVKGFSTTKQKG